MNTRWEPYDPRIDIIVRRPPCDHCDTPATWVQPNPGTDRYCCSTHHLDDHGMFTLPSGAVITAVTHHA